MRSLNVTRESVGAVIVNNSGRYLLQGRDEFPSIHLPGYWGLFGGSMESGETPLAGMQRELLEELNLVPTAINFLTQAIFDVPAARFYNQRLIFFEVRLEQADSSRLVLKEGKSMEWFNFHELALQERVTPWAIYGIYFHSLRMRGELSE